ncbi:MAG: hypothetical protein E6I48_03280 [Chloroflexi bacterium]|nr:MAG: hypothetical protein E6I48_03280 [Chloroflexota bacterium]
MFFALVALWMTWPLALRLNRSLGGLVFPFDQYLLMYVLEWGRHVLPFHPGEFFDATLCYPAPRMLGTVEHLLGLWPLYALVRLAVPDVISAYHVLTLTVFILCALAMAVLVLRWTGDALAGAVAGAIYAFAPVRLTCWAWMHVLVTFCFPLLLLAIEGVLWGRPLVGILLLGLLLVSQVVLTVYGAAFAAVTMLIFTAAYVLGLGRPRPWRRLALLPLAAVATLPLLLVLFHVYGSAVVFPADGTLGAALGRQAASLFALDPLASLAELGERFARVAGLVRQAPGPGDAVLPLDAGRPALVLAPIGIWSLLRAGDRRDRSRALGIGALVVVGLALAVGPGFMPVPFAAIPLPIVWLGELPVFGWLRSPERYVLVALVGLAAAAGLGFARLLRGRSLVTRLAGVAIVLALLRWDAGPFPLSPVSPTGEPSEVVRELAERGDGAPVLDWPVLLPPATAARRTLEAAAYWQPTTLCFTGTYPRPWLAFAEQMAAARTPDAFAALVERAGIGWILVHKGEWKFPGSFAAAAGATLVQEDGGHALFACPGGQDRRGHAGGQGEIRSVRLAVALPPAVRPGARVEAQVEIVNPASVPWPGAGNLVRLRTGWRTAGGERLLAVTDPARLALLARLPSHWARALRTFDVVPDHEVAFDRELAARGRTTIVVAAAAPSRPGRYRFVAGLVAAAGAPLSLADGGTERAEEVDVVEAAAPGR